MQIGLSALSFGYRCGFLGQGTERAARQLLDLDGLISLAAQAGLHSLEFPFALLPDRSLAGLDTLRGQLESCGLTPILDSDLVDVGALAEQIPLAAALGAKLMRVLISPVREGNRASLAIPWPEQIASSIAQLRLACPIAEANGITLAMENHQDATSDDLLQIAAEVDSPALGVTYDPVNALAVAEEPIAALQALGPLVCNVHIADFVTYPSPQGYRLVRCALGEGELNFRHLFALLEQLAPAVSCQIEMVSHASRHIQLLTEEWWQGYGPRDVRSVLPALRMLAQSGGPSADDWRTPWERGAGEAVVSFYEDQQFASSVSFLRSIGLLSRSVEE